MNSTAILTTAGAVTTVSIVALLIYAVSRDRHVSEVVGKAAREDTGGTIAPAYIISGSPQTTVANGDYGIAQQFITTIGPKTEDAIRLGSRKLAIAAQNAMAFVNVDQYLPTF